MSGLPNPGELTHRVDQLSKVNNQSIKPARDWQTRLFLTSGLADPIKPTGPAADPTDPTDTTNSTTTSNTKTTTWTGLGATVYPEAS